MVETFSRNRVNISVEIYLYIYRQIDLYSNFNLFQNVDWREEASKWPNQLFIRFLSRDIYCEIKKCYS